jgi:hypothetical protein
MGQISRKTPKQMPKKMGEKVSNNGEQGLSRLNSCMAFMAGSQTAMNADQ